MWDWPRSVANQARTSRTLPSLLVARFPTATRTKARRDGSSDGSQVGKPATRQAWKLALLGATEPAKAIPLLLGFRTIKAGAGGRSGCCSKAASRRDWWRPLG